MNSVSVSKNALRFILVGIINTLIHIGVAYICLQHLSWSLIASNGVAFLTATCFSYIGNTLWSFQQTVNFTNFRRFSVVVVLGLTVSVIISGGAEAMGLPDYLGVAIVIFSLPLITFCLHHFWTYSVAETG